MSTTYAGDLLMAATGIAGLTNPRIDLFTAQANPSSKNSVWSDFTIATYTGYATVTPTIGTVYISRETGLVSVDVSDAVFPGPSSGSGVSTLGWVLHDTTATPVVYASGTWDGPLAEQLPTDRIVVDETIGLSSAVVFHVDN
jgi:hypothetical protein